MAQSYNDRRRVLQGGRRRRLMCACGITSDLLSPISEESEEKRMEVVEFQCRVCAPEEPNLKGACKQPGNILEVEDNRSRFDMALACFDRTIDWRYLICHQLICFGRKTKDNLRNLNREILFKIFCLS